MSQGLTFHLMGFDKITEFLVQSFDVHTGLTVFETDALIRDPLGDLIGEYPLDEPLRQRLLIEAKDLTLSEDLDWFFSIPAPQPSVTPRLSRPAPA